MRHVGRSLQLFLLGAVAGLAGCGGGVPGDPVAVGSLPPPPKGIVAEGKAPQVFTVAGDGRGGPVLAWLDRADDGPAIKVARYDGRREAPWGSPETYPGEVTLPQTGVELSLLPLPAGNGSLLAFHAGRRVLALHPERDWRETLDDGTEFKHFVAASGPMGVWAVAQVAGDVPRLVKYEADRDAPWDIQAPLPVDDLGPRPPALAVGQDSITVAYLEFSGESVAQTDLRIARWDGGAWSQVAVFDDVGAVTPIVCPGGRITAWAAIGGDGHRVEAAVDRGGSWSRRLLREAAGVVNDLQCVVDDAGRALLAWMANEQVDGESPAYHLWTARFDGADWQAPERLAEPDATEATQAQSFYIAGQPRDGQAVVVYHMLGDRGDGAIWSRRFDPADGWGPPRQVSGCCAPAQVAMDGSGTAAVVWVDRQGPLWWARLDAEEAAP